MFLINNILTFLSLYLDPNIWGKPRFLPKKLMGKPRILVKTIVGVSEKWLSKVSFCILNYGEI